MRHITIDLETMGNTSTAAIVSIGAVIFETGTEETHEFYTGVSLDDCLAQGLTTDADTIYWWLMQDEKARAEIAVNVERRPLFMALSMLTEFMESKMVPVNLRQCWTHATFDAPILANAYKACGLQNPIHFRNQRDIRTLEELKPWDDSVQRDGTKHNALDDARYQAKYIRRLLELR